MAAVIADVTSLIAGDAEAGCIRWIGGAVENSLLSPIAAGSPRPHAPDVGFFASLASRLRREGHVLAAFVCQHHATTQSDDDAEQWAALGDLAHIIGRREDARDAYERYLRLAPGDAEVEHTLVSLRGDPAPPRAPDDCIVQLYARFAECYERNMRKELEYCGPEVLAAALHRELGPVTGLDVVDLGCGTGLAGPPLRPLARRVDRGRSLTGHGEARNRDRSLRRGRRRGDHRLVDADARPRLRFDCRLHIHRLTATWRALPARISALEGYQFAGRRAATWHSPRWPNSNPVS